MRAELVPLLFFIGDEEERKKNNRHAEFFFLTNECQLDTTAWQSRAVSPLIGTRRANNTLVWPSRPKVNFHGDTSEVCQQIYHVNLRTGNKSDRATGQLRIPLAYAICIITDFLMLHIGRRAFPFSSSIKNPFNFLGGNNFVFFNWFWRNFPEFQSEL